MVNELPSKINFSQKFAAQEKEMIESALKESVGNSYSDHPARLPF